MYSMAKGAVPAAALLLLSDLPPQPTDASCLHVTTVKEVRQWTAELSWRELHEIQGFVLPKPPHFRSPQPCAYCNAPLSCREVLYVCTACFKVHCALCEEEVRTGIPTPGSQHYAARAPQQAACAGSAPTPLDLSSTIDVRICDLCDVTLPPGSSTFTSVDVLPHDSSVPEIAAFFSPSLDAMDCKDVCAACAATDDGKEHIAQHQLHAYIRPSADVNVVLGFGELASWAPVYAARSGDRMSGCYVLVNLDAQASFKTALYGCAEEEGEVSLFTMPLTVQEVVEYAETHTFKELMGHAELPMEF